MTNLTGNSTGHSILPGEKCPSLSLPLINGDRFDIRQKSSDRMLLIFYRGLHCPKCKQQLQTVEEKLGQFRKRGIMPIAISMDDQARAECVRSDWSVKNLPVGFDLSNSSARQWGLFLSQAVFDNEPDEFNEPGLFLIEPDNMLYAAWIQSTPFARPAVDDLLSAIDFIQEKKYPARGKVARTERVVVCTPCHSGRVLSLRLLARPL
jgi:peroxiredoxin